MSVPLTISTLHRVVDDVNAWISMASPIPKTETGWRLVETVTVEIVQNLKDCNAIPDVDFDVVWKCIRSGLVYVAPDGTVTPRQKN